MTTTERKDAIKRFVELHNELKERKPSATPYAEFVVDIDRYLKSKFPDKSQAELMEAYAYIGNRAGMMIQDMMRGYEIECRKHYQRYYEELFKVMKKGDKED